jgi:hypothetical protein
LIKGAQTEEAAPPLSRREMRADLEMFPPFTGRPTHFPTETFDLIDANR